MSQAELDMASQGPDLAPAISTLLATDGSDHALKAARFVAGILPAGAQIEPAWSQKDMQAARQ